VSETLRWGAATDTGRVREANEDAYLAEPLVFAVADGMGGHQAGEVASAMAADVLRERLATGAPSTDVMEAAVVEANAAIFQTARRNSSQMGMGTTLTALAVVPATDSTPTQLALANVGDSRTYVLAQGRLRRATIDHSYVQELLATGHITEDEARHHPRRNIVTRALGIEPSVRVDSWLLPLVRGERYILCSDGLVDEIDDDTIAAIARQHDDPQTAADQLVAAALASGGRDNVTVVVVDVLEGAEPEPLAEPAELAAALAADLAAGIVTTTPPAPTVSEAVIGGVAADPVAPLATAAPTPIRNRQITGRTFMFLLLVAVVLTVIITLIAVAVSSTDTPAPTSTVPTSTTVATSTSLATSTTAAVPSTTAPTTALVTTIAP
jgi:serine/threonine protein phosphatase PrpC